MPRATWRPCSSHSSRGFISAVESPVPGGAATLHDNGTRLAPGVEGRVGTVSSTLLLVLQASAGARACLSGLHN